MSNKKIKSISQIEIISPDSSREDYINNKAVVELAAFLKENKEFMVYAGAIIDECLEAQYLSESQSVVEFYEENFVDDMSQDNCMNNEEFINKIFALYNTYSDEGKIANVRGAVLERLTLLLILERYMYSNKDIYLPIKRSLLLEHCELEVDCKVKVNYSQWTTENPIDVVGWNKESSVGEVYECKIKKSGMEKSDEEILYKLDRTCNLDSNIKGFRVGVVTFSNTKYINSYFEHSKDKSDSKVMIYGRNNIDDISKGVELY